MATTANLANPTDLVRFAEACPLLNSISFHQNGAVSKIEFADLMPLTEWRQGQIERTRFHGSFREQAQWRALRQKVWATSPQALGRRRTAPVPQAIIPPGPAMGAAKISPPAQPRIATTKSATAKSRTGIIRHLSDWPNWRG